MAADSLPFSSAPLMNVGGGFKWASGLYQKIKHACKPCRYEGWPAYPRPLTRLLPKCVVIRAVFWRQENSPAYLYLPSRLFRICFWSVYLAFALYISYFQRPKRRLTGFLQVFSHLQGITEWSYYSQGHKTNHVYDPNSQFKVKKGDYPGPSKCILIFRVSKGHTIPRVIKLAMDMDMENPSNV